MMLLENGNSPSPASDVLFSRVVVLCSIVKEIRYSRTMHFIWLPC